MAAEQENWEIPELDGFITLSLAARILGVSRQAAHRIVRRGELPGARHIPGPGDGVVVVQESEVKELAGRRVGRQVVQVLEGAG